MCNISVLMLWGARANVCADLKSTFQERTLFSNNREQFGDLLERHSPVFVSPAHSLKHSVLLWRAMPGAAAGKTQPTEGLESHTVNQNSHASWHANAALKLISYIVPLHHIETHTDADAHPHGRCYNDLMWVDWHALLFAKQKQRLVLRMKSDLRHEVTLSSVPFVCCIIVRKMPLYTMKED